jgi:hypothetical protein
LKNGIIQGYNGINNMFFWGMMWRCFLREHPLLDKISWACQPNKMVEQLSSVQNLSVLPFNPGWLIGIPLLDYYDPQDIG